MSTLNTKAIKSVITIQQANIVFKEIKDEPSDTAGRILADALWKAGRGESAPTEIG